VRGITASAPGTVEPKVYSAPKEGKSYNPTSSGERRNGSKSGMIGQIDPEDCDNTVLDCGTGPYPAGHTGAPLADRVDKSGGPQRAGPKVASLAWLCQAAFVPDIR